MGIDFRGFVRKIGVKLIYVFVIVEGESYYLLLSDSAFEEMVKEKRVKQAGFAASSDSGYDLDEPIVLSDDRII